jgi:radical SAM protein with 4Fe4S-binding SPASM domain
MADVHPEIERLLAWRRGEKPGPLRLHLPVTERCNLGCLSCYMGQRGGGPVEPEMSDELLLDVVDSATRLGVEEFYLVGGEPFVRRSVTLRMMERIKAAGARGELTTNGTRLRDEDVEQITAMGWDMLQVSVDGADAATNDRLRPPAGTFDAAMGTLDRFRAAKARQGSSRPRICVATVVSRHNVHQLPAILDLAADRGAEEVTFQALKDMSTRFDELELDTALRDELDRVARSAQERARARGVATNAGDLRQPELLEDMVALDRVIGDELDDVTDPLFRAHCFTPFTTLVVHFDGRVSPCWEWRGPDLGNVRDTSLADIWYGPVFQAWRDGFTESRMPGHCSRCCLGFVDHVRWLRLEGLLAAGEYAAALELADRLLDWQPDHRHGVVARAKALLGLGRGADAERWVAHVLDEVLPGKSLERAYLVDVLCDGGRVDAARRLGESVLALADGDGPVAEAARRLRDRLAGV